MKIFTNNAVFVQKNDIAYLTRGYLKVPVSIFTKSFGNDTFYIDNNSKYDFIEFNKPHEINFFKNIDWIVDYNEVKNLSKEETIVLGERIAEEINKIANKFNKMTPAQKKKNMKLVSQCELLKYKMCSLKEIFWFKEGQIKINLPLDIETQTELRQEKGIKKLVKTMFNKKKN